MNNVPIVFDLVILWFIAEFVVADVIPAIRRHGARITSMDRGSKLLLNLTLYPSLAIAFLFAIYRIALLPDWTFYPGLTLMMAGILFRLWAVLWLGRYFSEQVGVQEGHKVEDTGPNRYIRHPSYTGALLAFLGIGLALESWGAILLLLVASALAFGYRIHVEEKALTSALGDEYVRYAERTRRLIPYIF